MLRGSASASAVDWATPARRPPRGRGDGRLVLGAHPSVVAGQARVARAAAQGGGGAGGGGTGARGGATTSFSDR